MATNNYAVKNCPASPRFHLYLWLSAMTLAVLLNAGCGNPQDLYADCTLSPTAVANIERICSGESVASCAVNGYAQCETLSCVKYNSSLPFCSKTCEQDSDCGGGFCTIIVHGDNKKYCVKDDLESKDNSSS